MLVFFGDSVRPGDVRLFAYQLKARAPISLQQILKACFIQFLPKDPKASDGLCIPSEAHCSLWTT